MPSCPVLGQGKESVFKAGYGEVGVSEPEWNLPSAEDTVRIQFSARSVEHLITW